MTNEAIRQQLNQILNKWVGSPIIQSDKSIIGIIQFGSTTKNIIKHQTDVDLLIIFNQLPQKKMERSLRIDPIHESLESELKKINGYELVPSIVVKSKDNCDMLSPIYLDMTENSNTLYDPEGVIKRLLERTHAWIKRHGSYKVQKGNLWYWILDPKEPNKKALSYKLDE